MFTKNNNIKVKCKIDEKVKFILVALAAILKSLLILIKKVSKLLLLFEVPIKHRK